MCTIVVLAVSVLLAPVNALYPTSSAEQKLDLRGKNQPAELEESVKYVGPDSTSVLSVRVTHKE